MSKNRKISLEPGTIVAGKYEIERLIGRGGMGQIVAAKHLQLEETVALKFLLAPDERADEFRLRFMREAQITAKLRGAHVARTLDFGVTEDGDPFIVMEYLDGINLRQLLRENGTLPLEVAVGYALQACEGLAEAHRLDVVHRDLKPANLFLTKHLDGGDLVKLLDFGVSKLRNFASGQELTAAGVILGSPKYMSMEQLAQAADVDERADIWSLGTILYEMLAGRPAFKGKHTAAICMEIMHGKGPPPLSEVRSEVPPALDQAVMRCLRRERDERTPNVAVLARELADGAGIDGFDAAAKAVEDVLLNPRSLAGTGQVRAFGQSGSHQASLGLSGTQSSGRGAPVKSAPKPKDSRRDSPPEQSVFASAKSALAELDGRARLLLVAVVALVAVVTVGAIVYFALKGDPQSSAPTIVAPAGSASVAPD